LLSARSGSVAPDWSELAMPPAGFPAQHTAHLLPSALLPAALSHSERSQFNPYTQSVSWQTPY
jgi:hypothetical protein